MRPLGIILLLLIPLWAIAIPPRGVEPEATVSQDSNHTQASLNSKKLEFMTTADRLSATLSNISIKNIGAEVTITGIYLFVLAPGVDDSCVAPLIESEGAPFGAQWAPKVTIANSETKSIGANYLYNMIMLFLYEASVERHETPPGTPGNYDGGHTYCLWIGVTNQTVNTVQLTNTNGTLNDANQLVQVIDGDPPTSFTNVTCSDLTRLCSTADRIDPQPFPHQRPLIFIKI